MERAVQIFAVIHLVVIGVSHIAAPKAWAEFFIALREKGRAGVLVVAFLSLGFGSIVVAFHRVWEGIPLILTLLGFAQLIKAGIYMTFPSYGLRALDRVSEERARMFIPAGIALLVVAGLLVYSLAGG